MPGSMADSENKPDNIWSVAGHLFQKIWTKTAIRFVQKWPGSYFIK